MRIVVLAVLALALAAPAAAGASVPVLSAVGHSDQHPTATFAAAGADDATMYVATDPAQATDGRFFEENVLEIDPLTAAEIASGYWLSASQLVAGTYYVQLSATDWDCQGEPDCLDGVSNVLTLTIPEPPGDPGPPLGPAPLTKAEAIAEARKALKARFGRKWTRGHRKRLACTATADDAFRCRARWRYRGRAFRRTVLVVERNGTVSVSIFAG